MIIFINGLIKRRLRIELSPPTSTWHNCCQLFCYLLPQHDRTTPSVFHIMKHTRNTIITINVFYVVSLTRQSFLPVRASQVDFQRYLWVKIMWHIASNSISVLLIEALYGNLSMPVLAGISATVWPCRFFVTLPHVGCLYMHYVFNITSFYLFYVSYLFA